MQAEPYIMFLWSFAVVMSGIMSSLICFVTLKHKYSKKRTILGYSLACIIGFLLCFYTYSFDITNDFTGIIGVSVIIWIFSYLLCEQGIYESLFVSIMATLISNVCTFFLCGTTLSFIDNASNPYNESTIIKFIAIKFIWFTILFIIYNTQFKDSIKKVLEILRSKISSYLPISIISFFGFYVINMITNSLGVFPSIPDMRYNFIFLYGIICIIFIFGYYQIVSSVFLSSAAHKTEIELSVASKIQHHLLPCIFPPFPDRDEFEIYAMMRPAKEVGGDFYDFFLIDKDHIGVVVADVSGKGVPAALFMVITKTLIKNQSQFGLTPSEVFNKANNQLCENNESSMFVTAFMGILDIKTGKLTYVNAGHNQPLLKRKNGEFEFFNTKTGFILAGMEDIKYKEYEMQLYSGDILYLYTDGVTEATDIHNNLYGDKRLKDMLNLSKDKSLQSILTDIEEDIDLFADGREQFDDITMLALKINTGEGNI